MIRTGLLCIPAYDETASAAVRGLLRRVAPATMIIADRHIEDRRYPLEEVLRRWCDEDELDLILTIGGALPAPGPSSRQCVPDATTTVIERAMPSLSEAMRAVAAAQSRLALLDRGVAGIRGRTLIVNLPAGANAAVLAHLHEGERAPSLEEALTAQAGPDLTPPPPAAEKRPGRGLDPAEFAAFLQRSAGTADPGAG
jgi:molybdopterin biosynthesis enzyme MoaB